MTALDNLLLLALLTVLLLLAGRRLSSLGWYLTILFGAQFAGLLMMGALGYGAPPVPSSLHIGVMGQVMQWRFDALSWLFALITVGAGLTSSWYLAGDWGRHYRQRGGNLWLLQLALAVNVFSMLLLLASGDLLSLFIGWELVSWSAFLLMALNGADAMRAALRYITYAMAGAMAMMAGLGLVLHTAGSLQYADLAAAVPTLSSPQLWGLILLFGMGFGVKMGLLPLHLWQARAYSETPGPGASFLGAVSTRMGLWGLILVLVQLVGLVPIADLAIPYTFLDARELLMWVAALTIILPTYTALRQNDARMLLAWHGIGQGGYMLLGVLMGDAMGSAGGLMHAFNYATYQAPLFMAVYAVRYRTGTSDLNRLGGLVTRMPLSFLVMLVGIIGLAGLPPMNGFVSKWLIYRGLINDGQPLLFIAAVVGTFGTILSVYKLIHNTFLGQLRLEHVEVREAPWSMTVPMLLLSAVVFVTGYLPGLVLDWVAAAQQAVGLPVLVHTLGGVESPLGSLDMIWVSSLMFAGFGIGALLFYAGGNRSKAVHQLDNYAGGHFLSADVRYQYSDHFYAGLMRHIGPLYRNSFQWLEGALGTTVETLGAAMRAFYRQHHPAIYLLAVTTAGLIWVIL
ncbi:MAG TPA: NADH dehydrogenase subunit [Sedimenticola thiotaurini]|uniref:NADH dehydrogenase subunit n=1 Tax=Sedimenticola thiotaurini TaxID=1543721 RepID=A0A831RKE4_9GAMM|nr:NADH dehydrogenase subunit [Sedimenticola thiotaurini]